jgi:hypothetical protein
MKKSIFLWLLYLCSFSVYAQFSLDANGVTVKCPGKNAGDTGVVDGVTYIVCSGSMEEYVNIEDRSNNRRDM